MKQIILIILLIIPITVNAQKKKTVEVYGSVEDYVTRNPLINSKVYLLRPDSSLVDTCRAIHGYKEGKILSDYVFENIDEGRYILNWNVTVMKQLSPLLI
jgi:hypothetical protein